MNEKYFICKKDSKRIKMLKDIYYLHVLRITDGIVSSEITNKNTISAL